MAAFERHASPEFRPLPDWRRTNVRETHLPADFHHQQVFYRRSGPLPFVLSPDPGQLNGLMPALYAYTALNTHT